FISVAASGCAKPSMPARGERWIASSLPLLAMTRRFYSIGKERGTTTTRLLAVRCVRGLRHSLTSLLHQRTFRIGRAECVLSGNLRQDLVIVPRIFRLFRRLDLHQHQIVHHQIVLAQSAVAG